MFHGIQVPADGAVFLVLGQPLATGKVVYLLLWVLDVGYYYLEGDNTTNMFEVIKKNKQISLPFNKSLVNQFKLDWYISSYLFLAPPSNICFFIN